MLSSRKETEYSRSTPAIATNKLVLVVDDEQHIVDLVQIVLDSRGLRSDCVGDGDEALALLQERDYDLLICDYHMPGSGGRELLQWIQQSGKTTKVLVLSGDVLHDETLRLVEMHQGRFLAKPFGIEDLLSSVDQLFAV